MVVQVVAHTLQVYQAFDTMRLHMSGRADARQHQQLWRIDYPTAEYDLPAGLCVM